MRIAVLTSLYPTAQRPFEGIFAERRWAGMLARGHSVRVVQPLPYSPGSLGLGGEHWRAVARAAATETRQGIEIRRPRYVHLPRLATGNARRFARRGVAELLGAGAGSRRPPEVVCCDYAWPAAAAAQQLAQRGIPVVISGRGSDVLQVAGVSSLRPGLERGLRAAGHWLAVSQDLVNAMDDLGGIPGRGVLVPNGVDLERFAPRDRAACRAELGLDPEGQLVLVVGHLIERKDPRLALRAFAAGASPGARLVFLGRGPLEELLRQEAAELGLAQRVSLLGERGPEQLSAWYGACDLLLLCSTREGRPNVVLEALASGRAVLATQAGGTAELLEGLDGALASTREAAELGALLRAQLAHPAPPERLRAQVTDLSWEASFTRLESCLAAAVAARQDAPESPAV